MRKGSAGILAGGLILCMLGAAFAGTGPGAFAARASGAAIPEAMPSQAKQSQDTRLERLWEDVAAHSDSARAMAKLGDGYLESGETELAEQCFRMAMDLLDGDSELDESRRKALRRSLEWKLPCLKEQRQRARGSEATLSP